MQSAGTPKDVEGVVANFMLTLPFYKHVFAWMGGHPAGATPGHAIPSQIRCCLGEVNVIMDIACSCEFALPGAAAISALMLTYSALICDVCRCKNIQTPAAADECGHAARGPCCHDQRRHFQQRSHLHPQA